MKEKLAVRKSKYSFFGSISVRGAGHSIRAVRNFASKTLGALSEKFIFTSARAFGAFGLTYGLLSLILYYGKSYFENVTEIDPVYMAVGIVSCVLSAPLLFFDKPICLFLQDFYISDFVLFEFFSLKRMDVVDAVPGFSVLFAVILGVIPAAVGIFVSPLYVLLVIFLLVFFFAAILTPEFPVIFALLIAPYLSPIPDTGLILASLALLSFVSFAAKVATGKRAYHFEIYDALFFLVSVFFFIGGLVNGDVADSLVMLAITLSYVPVSNIIVNRRLADCAVNALIISSLPISIASIIQYAFSFSGKLSFNGQSVFASQDGFAAFLLIATTLSVFFAKEKKAVIKKIFYSFVAALHLANVVFIWKSALWLTLLVSVFAYAVISSKKVRKELLVILLALPYVLLFFTEGMFVWASEFFSITPSASERFELWKAGLEKISENVVFGFGFGSAELGSNAFIALALNFGVPILAILALVFLLRTVQLSAYSAFMSGSLLMILSEGLAMSVFGLFALGAWIDVFSDITIYFLFIMIFGLSSASMRISRHEYLERVDYYKDLRSVDSSDVSVRLSR